MDKDERKEMIPKMVSVLKTNSILNYPEGSHILSPDKIINHLFDVPVNVAEQSGCKIVTVSYLQDSDHHISFMDFSNPIDVQRLSADVEFYYPGKPHNEKYRMKAKTKKNMLKL